ncbi:MAG: glycine cleavage system protein GcvH [Mobilitalea sp.]
MKKQEFLYAKSHEWVQYLSTTTARVGISDYAQRELGDLVFINLPEVGDALVAGEEFADVESVKAVSNIYSPVTGTVKAVNEELLDHPELVNSDAAEAWFVEVEEIRDHSELLTEEDYKAQIS